jgi:competence protein ComEC
MERGLYMKWHNNKLLIIILLAFLLSGCSIQFHDTAPVVENQANSTASEQPVSSQTRVHYIDVGQGDAVLVQSAGQNMLIDAGDNSHGQQVVDYLKSMGIKQLDIIVGTHPHADHIGGIDTVLQAFPVKAVYMPRITHTSESFSDVLNAIEAQNLKINTARAGTVLPLTGVKAEILAPVKDNYEDLNNYSAVIRIVCGKRVFLFMGDAEKEAEADLLATGTDLKADVLKVGHHGSHSSTSEPFLSSVKPQYAIIMLGADNPYGHPHTETLKRLNRNGIKILRTDLNGTIVITTDGNLLQIKTDR